MSQWVWAWILLIASLIFFGLSAFTRLDDPAAQDELCELGAADSLFEDGVARDIYNDDTPVAYSPHLNLLLIHASFSAFGQSIFAARIVGVVFSLATLLLIFHIVRRRGEGDEGRRMVIAASVTALCASLPVFVQASTLLHIDNSMLTFLVLGMVYSAQRYYEQPNRLRGFIFVMFVAGSLWARITTPLLLAPLIFLFSWGAETRRVRWQLPLLFAGGATIFLGTWALYCLAVGAPFAQPFTYTWDAFMNRTGRESSRFTMRALGTNAIQTVAWVGVIATGLYFFTASRRVFDFLIERRPKREDLYFTCGWAVLLGYTIVGGAPFGFPKYQCPAFPLLSIALGLAGTRVDWSSVRIRPSVAVGSFVAAFLVQWVFCGDVVKRVRVDLREAQAGGLVAPETVLRAALVALGISIAAWGIIFLLSLASGFRHRAAFALLPVAIGASASMVTLQNMSGGATGYSYGSAHALEVALELDRVLELADHSSSEEPVDGQLPDGHLPGGETPTGIVPSEVIYLMRDRELEYVPNRLWTDRVELKKRLEDPRNRVFVLSVPTNTVGQVRIAREDREIKTILTRDYEYTKIGTFHVWRRP